MKKQLEAVIEAVPCALSSATQPPLQGTSAEAMLKGTERAENCALRSPRASLEDTYTTYALCLTCVVKMHLLEVASHCTSALQHCDKFNLLLDGLQ